MVDGRSAETTLVGEATFTELARPLAAIIAYPDWTLVGSGQIDLKLVISAEGVVESTDVLVSSGNDSVDDAFREASVASLFSPCHSGAEPIGCTISYHWNFVRRTLQDGIIDTTFCGSVGGVF